MTAEGPEAVSPRPKSPPGRPRSGSDGAEPPRTAAPHESPRKWDEFFFVEEPSSATEERYFFAEKPSSATEEPFFFAEKPSSAAEKPFFFVEKPSSAAEKPFFFAEKPSSAAEKPFFFVEKPSSAAEKPYFFAEKSSFFAEIPFFFAEEPRNTPNGRPSWPPRRENGGKMSLPAPHYPPFNCIPSPCKAHAPQRQAPRPTRGSCRLRLSRHLGSRLVFQRRLS